RFFLNGVNPDAVGVEGEVSGPIAWGRIREGYGRWSERRAASWGQFPDINPVLSRIGSQNPLIGGVRLHLVRVTIRPFMSTERKTRGRMVGWGRRPDVI